MLFAPSWRQCKCVLNTCCGYRTQSKNKFIYEDWGTAQNLLRVHSFKYLVRLYFMKEEWGIQQFTPFHFAGLLWAGSKSWCPSGLCTGWTRHQHVVPDPHTHAAQGSSDPRMPLIDSWRCFMKPTTRYRSTSSTASKIPPSLWHCPIRG